MECLIRTLGIDIFTDAVIYVIKGNAISSYGPHGSLRGTGEADATPELMLMALSTEVALSVGVNRDFFVCIIDRIRNGRLRDGDALRDSVTI
jgi:hypothetical protein